MTPNQRGAEQKPVMDQSQDGYLLIADITGYTAFLRESELEHAKDSLRTLLDLLIEQTKPPLRISRLEGDAVISYALQGQLPEGSNTGRFDRSNIC